MIGRFFRMIKFHFQCLFSTSFWFLYQLCRGNFHNYLYQDDQKKNLIILATGPSLKEDLVMGITDLQFSDICVVNEFCMHPMFEKLKPTLYLLADPLYFCEDIMRDVDKKTVDVLSKINWSITIYVPYHYYHMVYKKLESKYVSVCPYHCNPYSGWISVRDYLYNKGLSMPAAQNVLIPSIFNGINLGYKQIKLFGVDHSWTKEIRVNNNNQVCLCDCHFYDVDKPILSPWKKCGGEYYKMHEILRDLALMFEGYQHLKEYADSKNCHIINMTKDSFIDAFERGYHD